MAAAKKKKKAAKKKTAKASGKKKGSTKATADPTTFPTGNIEALAWHVLKSGKEDFRKKASEPGKFKEALKKELDDHGIPGIGCMHDDEKTFCEGWLDLARLEHGGNYFDEKLVILIRERLDFGKINVING